MSSDRATKPLTTYRLTKIGRWWISTILATLGIIAAFLTAFFTRNAAPVVATDGKVVITMRGSYYVNFEKPLSGDPRLFFRSDQTGLQVRVQQISHRGFSFTVESRVGKSVKLEYEAWTLQALPSRIATSNSVEVSTTDEAIILP